ncbi:MAG: hypothetical protein ACI822_001048 [Gammaproteobacteria bacterium]|jgi:uncharacterized protein YigA (DUF484 family)
MNDASAESQQSEQIDESKVIDYLHKNPEILMAYPQLFSSLQIPHQTEGAVSLVERQLKLLREQNQAYKAKIDELVSIARENEELNQRFHRLALELMNTDQLHDVLAMVQDQVQTFFYTDFVCFRFVPGVSADSNILDGLCIKPEGDIMSTLKPWLAGRTPICGQQSAKVNNALFGENLRIGSSALIPLFHTSEMGFLCLGSVSSDRFTKSIGTIFLQQLGELVSSRLKVLLQVSD